MNYLTVIHYPNGFQHKKGFLQNAELIKYFDAEELLGYGLKSLDPEDRSIKVKKSRLSSLP